jgi:hypothetical protein
MTVTMQNLERLRLAEMAEFTQISNPAPETEALSVHRVFCADSLTLRL